MPAAKKIYTVKAHRILSNICHGSIIYVRLDHKYASALYQLMAYNAGPSEQVQRKQPDTQQVCDTTL